MPNPSPKPPKKGKERLLSPQFPIPNPNLDPMPAGEGSSGDAALDRAEILSREEVLRRRSRRAKQLARVYWRHYWALVEEIRVKYRDYYWEFGKSPLEEEAAAAAAAAAEAEENGSEEARERKRCGFAGCKSKAMPLTKFCHQHICHDRKQTLYKPCPFVTKSGQNMIKCQKPVLRATSPCLCTVHVQKIQKQIFQALKKAGLNCPNKAPKFHILIAESVRQIQARRRKALIAPKNSDKPSASSLKTDQTELDVTSNNMPRPMEEKITILRGKENNIGGMPGLNPNNAQLACSATTVK